MTDESSARERNAKYLSRIAEEAGEAADRLERVEAVVILAYSPSRDRIDGNDPYHVEEIRATVPFLELHHRSVGHFDLRVGTWLTEAVAKAVCLAVSDVRIVVYRAEVTR